ncbi:MAG TPA: hypothetical protein VKZ59_12690 [Acidobacteriota bacterium]|nr:hypothetical protein [Acidobacteriota bacterium]
MAFFSFVIIILAVVSLYLFLSIYLLVRFVGGYLLEKFYRKVRL